MPRDVVFLFNLLQDVNILRGLVFLARRETDARVRLFVSTIFHKRDSLGIWAKELEALAADVGAELLVFADSADLLFRLQGRGGLIFAASESNLDAHRETRDAFRIAPASYLKITLQHGLECIGFLQSREHIMAHGRDITFNADVVCGWLPADRLTSLTVPTRNKIYVTGPPTLLQRPTPGPEHPPRDSGIICENMHSVRLTISGDHKASFMDIFHAFCARQGAQGRNVTLRPHPGGQYVLKNKVALPDNVHLNNLPIYNVDLSGYRFGISAPSTVVLDMVLANIPVAVWRDGSGVMDAGNYDGLTEISGLEDWMAFAQEAEMRPQAILDRQTRFLDRLGMVRDPHEIYRRFARLMTNGLEAVCGAAPVAPAPVAQLPVPPDPAPVPAEPVGPQRVMFIVNVLVATLQLSFLKPLEPLVAENKMIHDILTEEDLRDRAGADPQSRQAGDWFLSKIEAFRPDIIVCCRYSGPHADRIVQYARQAGVPLIYHIDDDLLNVPLEVGAVKHRMHNSPQRLHTVRTLLDKSTLVYCSTEKLKQRFAETGFAAPMVAGRVYSTSRLYRAAEKTPVHRIGYMGTGTHAADLDLILPALERYLARNPAVQFELFGSIPMPEPLKRFGARVAEVPLVADYAAFRQVLADRAWAIGVSPLAPTRFNNVKANTKWIEYTASGMAVIAPKGMVYDDCAAEGRGLLVSPTEWERALQLLTDNPDLRYRMVLQAQAHLALHYSDATLRRQVLDIFETARASCAVTRVVA